MPRALIDEIDIPVRYQHPDLKKRRAVLRDTVDKLATDNARLAYHKKAADNQTLVKMLNRNVQRARRGKRII